MASRAVRALIIVEGPRLSSLARGSRRSHAEKPRATARPPLGRAAALAARPVAERGRSKLSLALLAFLAFFACVSVELVAHASELAASQHQDASPSQGHDDALRESSSDTARCRQACEAVPDAEASVAEPEDYEDDVGLDHPATRIAVDAAPLASLARQSVHFASVTWVLQHSVRSAHARGPP